MHVYNSFQEMAAGMGAGSQGCMSMFNMDSKQKESITSQMNSALQVIEQVQQAIIDATGEAVDTDPNLGKAFAQLDTAKNSIGSAARQVFMYKPAQTFPEEAAAGVAEGLRGLSKMGAEIREEDERQFAESQTPHQRRGW